MRLESKFWASFGEEAIDSRQMKTALRIDRHEVFLRVSDTRQNKVAAQPFVTFVTFPENDVIFRPVGLRNASQGGWS